jgi:ketosteroid isomerase-like protein
MNPDHPAARTEVTAAFERYERALNANDVATLNELFLDAPQTIRYGVAEQLYGHAEIAAFRGARPNIDITRTLLRVEITAWSPDFATANCEYRRNASGRHGRQSQTWMRTPAGWRVISAHVSLSPP